MEKDFTKWNNYKIKLENNNNKVLFKEGDIWWTSIGMNVGDESCGKGSEFRRPVLIIKKLSQTNCIIIPLSTKTKDGTWFAPYTIHGKECTALLYQIKMMNIKRFTKREAQLNSDDLNKIKKRLKQLLNL